MTKKRSIEEPTLFSMVDGEPFVPVPSPFVGMESDTFAASCTNEAAVGNPRFRCPLDKCPYYLLNCL